MRGKALLIALGLTDLLNNDLFGVLSGHAAEVQRWQVFDDLATEPVCAVDERGEVVPAGRQEAVHRDPIAGAAIVGDGDVVHVAVVVRVALGEIVTGAVVEDPQYAGLDLLGLPCRDIAPGYDRCGAADHGRGREDRAQGDGTR